MGLVWSRMPHALPEQLNREYVWVAHRLVRGGGDVVKDTGQGHCPEDEGSNRKGDGSVGNHYRQIWGSDIGDEVPCLLHWYDTASGEISLTFRKSLLPPSLGWSSRHFQRTPKTSILNSTAVRTPSLARRTVADRKSDSRPYARASDCRLPGAGI